MGYKTFFKRSFFLTLCLSLPVQLFAQKCPDWVNGYREDLPNSYLEVVWGDGRSMEEAKDIAAKNLLKHRSLGTGQHAEITVNNSSISVKGSHEISIKANIVDTYAEYRGAVCRVYLLVQVLKNPSYSFEPVSVTNKYPFSARVFVPGMAQIHKGQVGKGVGFICGEIAFIGGIVASECLRQSYDAKIPKTHSTVLRKTYADNANICLISRNIAIAGAAALYVWNIIDGAVAKGKKHIVIGDAQLRFAPYVTPETGGLALSVNF